MMTRWLSITALVVATAASACSSLDTGTPPPDAATGGGGGGGSSQPAPATTTYEGKLDAITPVAFGGPPDTQCNYKQGMQNLKLSLLIRSSGEVIGGAMTNHNVETIVGTCQFLPATPSDVSYTFTGAQTASDGTTLTFAGAPGNHPGASLVIKLVSAGAQKYNAALTITRTDLPGTTFTWTVNTSLPLTPKP